MIYKSVRFEHQLPYKSIRVFSPAILQNIFPQSGALLLYKRRLIRSLRSIIGIIGEKLAIMTMTSTATKQEHQQKKNSQTRTPKAPWRLQLCSWLWRFHWQESCSRTKKLLCLEKKSLQTRPTQHSDEAGSKKQFYNYDVQKGDITLFDFVDC